MFFYEGSQCPVCGQIFQETDDIVTCPDCGAPHHRACWKEHGHCHYQDRHASGFDWTVSERLSAEDTVNRCANCGTENPEFAEFCSHCGAPLEIRDEEQPSDTTASAEQHTVWNDRPPAGGAYYGPQGQYGEYQPFFAHRHDPYGGISQDEKIGDVTAAELAAVVGPNSAYYLPQFKKAKGNGGVSWNWAAFLLGPYWLFFRKMHSLESVSLLIGILWQIPPIVALSRWVDIQGLASSSDIYMAVYTAMADRPPVLAVFMGLFVLYAAMHVLLGAFGTRIYLRSCTGRIRRTHRTNANLPVQALSAVGGTSFALALVAYMIEQFVIMLVRFL